MTSWCRKSCKRNYTHYHSFEHPKAAYTICWSSMSFKKNNKKYITWTIKNHAMIVPVQSTKFIVLHHKINASSLIQCRLNYKVWANHNFKYECCSNHKHKCAGMQMKVLFQNIITHFRNCNSCHTHVECLKPYHSYSNSYRWWIVWTFGDCI